MKCEMRKASSKINFVNKERGPDYATTKSCDKESSASAPSSHKEIGAAVISGPDNLPGNPRFCTFFHSWLTKPVYIQFMLASFSG